MSIGNQSKYLENNTFEISMDSFIYYNCLNYVVKYNISSKTIFYVHLGEEYCIIKCYYFS